MTNAKSRLVRIIALALAVLMIVPMALVGCKKTEAGVDQAALDAALKEALDAAQKAQDAADKAAQDAKDAQDKLSDAEKEAAKLQEQIDAMKNTTAAPATTTKAPVEDAAVIDPYIATMLYDAKSEYSQTVTYYVTLAAYGAYTDAEIEVLEDIIETAEVAITRAPSTDYVNQIVAKLKADLDAVPTFAERVYEAYTNIDFASNEDVIDVVFAANLAAKAYDSLKDADTVVINFTVTGDAETDKIYATLADVIEADLKAELAALGAEELDLATAINQEYYRYTGVYNKVPNADAVKPVDVLYEDVYKNVSVYKIAEKIAAIFDAVPGQELKVEDIVWGPAPLGTYGDDKDACKYITADYNDFYGEYKRESYASLKEAFEIAFIGEAYILITEENYLQAKLAEAKDRIVELEAAAKEYAKNSFSGKLEEIVADYNADGYDYLYTAKKNVDKINEILVDWMARYSFSKDSKNLDAIVGRANYNTFVEAKAYVDGVNAWAVKAEKIGIDMVEDLIDEYDDEAKYSYSKFGATALALEAWYKGTWNNKTNAYNADAVSTAADIKLPSGAIVSVSDANVVAILDEVFGLTKAEIEPALNYFRTDLLVRVDEANEINKAMSKIELDGLKLGSADYKKCQKAKDDIWAFFTAIGVEVEERNAAGEVVEWDLDSVNADLINWAKYENVVAAMKLASVDNIENASEIVKAYLAYFGAATDDNTVKLTRTEKDKNGLDKLVTYEFAIAPKLIVMRDYNSIKELATIKEAMSVAATKGIKDPVYVADIDGEQVEFSFEDAIKMYNEVAKAYYKNIMDVANSDALVIRNNAITDGAANTNNAWRANFSGDPSALALYNKFATISTVLGEYAPEFRFVGAKDLDDRDNDGDVTDTLSASSAKDGSVINLYNSSWTYKSGDKTYTYINAVLSVDYTKFVTKSSDGIIIAFDKQEYYNAVNAAVASYYNTWLVQYIKNNTATVVDKAQATVEYLVDYGFWTVEETIDVDGSAYKFVIDTVGTNAVLAVYDEDGYKVDYIKTKREGKTVYYDVDFVLNASYNPAVYGDVDLDAPFNGATLEKANIKIVVTEYEKDATGAYVASTIANAPTTLAQVLDVEEATYIYELADNAEAIKANLKTVPTNIVQYSSASSTYVIVTGTWLDKIIAGYKAAEYYEGVKVYYNAMTKCYNDSGVTDAAVKAMYDNYSITYKSPANYGGKTTLAGAVAAFEALVTEISVYN